MAFSSYTHGQRWKSNSRQDPSRSRSSSHSPHESDQLQAVLSPPVYEALYIRTAKTIFIAAPLFCDFAAW